MRILEAIPDTLGRLLSPSAMKATSLISLDCETTGLNPAKDSILSIGAVKIQNGVVKYGDTFHMMLRQDSSAEGAAPSTSNEAVKVHGILPEESKGGMPPEAAINKFISWAGDVPILGYNIAFDHAILKRHVRLFTNRPLKNQKLELMDVARRHCADALNRGLFSPGLESLAAFLGIPMDARHTALGDAMSVAMIYMAILKKFP